MASELHDSMRGPLCFGAGERVIWLSTSVRVHLSAPVDKAGSQSTHEDPTHDEGRSMHFSV
jgi:hypothetical protein